MADDVRVRGEMRNERWGVRNSDCGIVRHEFHELHKFQENNWSRITLMTQITRFGISDLEVRKSEELIPLQDFLPQSDTKFFAKLRKVV